MSSLCKVILIGKLGNDPTTRYLSNGDAVTNISLATTESWKGKTGEKTDRTEWHRVVFFGKLAEIAGKYLKKGNMVYLEGRIQTDKYTDKDGVEKYATKIIANELKMLGGQPQQRPHEEERKQRDSGFNEERDVPF